jgi:TonB family protein
MPLFRARTPCTGLGVLQLLVLTLVLPAAAPSQTLPDEGAGTRAEKSIYAEVLVPPRLTIDKKIDPYPSRAVRENHEGWTHLGFMVDTNGKPFEVTVIDSSGDKDLDTAAVRTLERAKITPGTLNGHPVESASEFTFTFLIMGGVNGAALEFRGWYYDLMKAIKAKNRAAADAAMTRITVTNLYEDAYFGLASFQYAQLWGDESQQLKGLQRTIANQPSGHYLSKPDLDAAFVEIIRLDATLIVTARPFRRGRICKKRELTLAGKRRSSP